jgi:hypothetical protein
MPGHPGRCLSNPELADERPEDGVPLEVADPLRDEGDLLRVHEWNRPEVRVAELLALTIAVEVGEISRFARPEQLVSYGPPASISPVKRGPAAARSTSRAHACSAGRPSKPRSRPGANRTLGTSSTSTSVAARVTPTPRRGHAQDPNRGLAHAPPQPALQPRPPDPPAAARSRQAPAWLWPR